MENLVVVGRGRVLVKFGTWDGSIFSISFHFISYVYLFCSSVLVGIVPCLQNIRLFF